MSDRVLYSTVGTVQASGGIYVCRDADEELFRLCQEGEFCYILTARQMGKSSLMVATRERLAAQGIRSVEIDLTQLGSKSSGLTAEQWYVGLVDIVVDQLDLDVDYMAWWGERAGLGLTQRWIQFLRQVALEQVSGPVVIFLDEIDTTLSLDFTDDFFAAVRSCHNARASDPAFKRLSFVLLGVATPSDLISDPRRTPFNIGRRIDLTDFTESQATPLASGLNLPAAEAAQVLSWILGWTGGHPYLTQRLCAAAVASPTKNWDTMAVDRLVEKTFFSEQSTQDSNLRFVRDMLTKRAPDKAVVLKAYQQIYSARRNVRDEERSLEKTHLKLSGIVKAENGLLRVRNQIYRRVFDLAWIRANTATNWAAIAAAAAITIALLAVGFIIHNAWVDLQVNESERRFYGATDPKERAEHLANMLEPPGFWQVTDYDYKARQLFFGLSREEQLEILNAGDVNGPKLAIVVRGIYVTLADVDGTGSTTPLLEAMVHALKRAHTTDETKLIDEITFWLEGRELVRQERFAEARTKYDQAIELNAGKPDLTNPAILYERARIWIKLGNYQEALTDCDQVMAIAGRIPNPPPAPTPVSTAALSSMTTTAPRVTPTTVTASETLTPSADRTPAVATTKSGPAPASSALPTASLARTPTPSARPLEMPTAAPASMPTLNPEASAFKSEFATTAQMQSAVRNLIDANPELGSLLAKASSTEYANLREFGLIPSPTATQTTTIATRATALASPPPTLTATTRAPVVSATTASLAVVWVGSPNFDSRPRSDDIRAIVMHATANASLGGTANWYNNSQAQISSHYAIGKDGTIAQFVRDEDRAWHAGTSEWKGISGLNDWSIGIDLVNLNDGIDPYPEAQHQAAVQLVSYLCARYNIQPDDIVANYDVSVPADRKTDPRGYDMDRLRREVAAALKAGAFAADVTLITRTMRVGLHGRNSELFEEVDYQLVREARIETLKMMSTTRPEVFKRLKDENPNIEFIVWLWDDRMGVGTHPTPDQFAARMLPIMEKLRPYVTKFEIHDEPNHLQRYNGWGQEDADARDFTQWFLQVYDLLHTAAPWAELGFPGLAIPHRDLEWIEIARPAVEKADWLGVHCYWLTTPQEPRNHLSDFWGLRFKYYHEKFPNKLIIITQFGNSNAQGGLPLTDDEMARQYVEYYQELFKYPYIHSANAFIMSSPDPAWDSFAWRTVGGEVKPVVAAVGDMLRPALESLPTPEAELAPAPTTQVIPIPSAQATPTPTALPTPVPPTATSAELRSTYGMNKLGFYTKNFGAPGVVDALKAVRPPVLLTELDDPDALRRIRREWSPETFIIGRPFVFTPADQDRMLDSDDPVKQGIQLADRIVNELPIASERIDGRPVVDAWMALNEPLPGPSASTDPTLVARRAAALDALQVGFLQRLRQEGLEAVAFNFGPGQWVTGEDYIKYFPKTLETYTYLGFHEYGWPTLYPAPDSITYAITYRKVMDEIRKGYLNKHRAIITEAGLARMLKDSTAGDVGWLYPGDTISEDQYWQSLQWYNNELVQDDYVIGACLFQLGPRAEWETFRLTGQDNQSRPLTLIDRIADLTKQPAPMPAP
jgi:tetratricopeptide (TPR) repeat protein